MRQIDHGWTEIRRQLRRLGVVVEAGYFRGVKGRVRTDQRKRPDLAVIAAVHEYGAPSRNIPARPFVTQGIEMNRDRIFRRAQESIAAALRARDPRPHFALVGNEMRTAIQDGIERGTFAPLDPKTIERKGSSKPLIDTGDLYNRVGWRVRRATRTGGGER